MRFAIAALLLCSFAAGQEASAPAASETAPPPEVDAALRARINHFYQAHVDGKFRIADQVVAEDSKDTFFAAPKQRYQSYEIVRINYKDNFQRADAVVKCAGEWTARGQRMKVNLVSTSTWKLEDGQWFWYVVPVTERATPFGVMHAQTAGQAATSEEQGRQSSAAAVLRDPQAAARMILESVKADKKELTLSSYEKSSGEVLITNGMQGSITLRADIDGRFPGLTFSLDKTEVAAGASARLTIVCEPKDRAAKPTLTARVFVEETGQVLPVQLLFAVPPEIERQIPKELRRPAPKP